MAYDPAPPRPASPFASPPHPASKMPTRKSDSSEKSESRRSSLRRLSSIASLHTLNPFNRRRSNNTTSTTDTPSSASNISLVSTTANPPLPHKEFSSSEIFTHHDNIEAVPPPAVQPQCPARRGSYICLPDDPIGGMPRSRTFSNLPLPTRAKKTGNPLVQSKSHARLPSTNLPPTRLPSPRGTNRKHSITRLAPLDTNVGNFSRVLNRSDTEPNLHLGFDHGGGVPLPRPTLFKENISLSPIKPLPDMDLLDDTVFFSSSPPNRIYADRRGHSNFHNLDGSHGSYDMKKPLLSPIHSQAISGSDISESSTSGYHGHPDRFYSRLHKKFESSPAYRSSKDRAPTPGQPVQRWNSQPVLSTKTNIRPSHGEIKQARLMSARQAPTPPPPKTPALSSEELNLIKLKSSNNSGHLRQASEQTAATTHSTMPTRERARSVVTGPGAVFTAEPLTYWTGRFSSLNDKYRNEELMNSFNIVAPSLGSANWKSKAETDRMHSTEANTVRMRRVVEHLYGQCATEEAKESFLRWQKQVAGALNLPELARPIGGRSCALAMSLKEEEPEPKSPVSEGQPLSASRKMSFMDRLLGKKSKILVAV